MVPFRKGPLSEVTNGGTIEKAVALTKDVDVYKKTFHCGDIASCPRKSVLHFLKPEAGETKVDAGSSFYMAIGKAVHEVVAEKLKLSGKLIRDEMKLIDYRVGPPKVHYLSGIIDLLFYDENEVPVIGEVKTCGNKLPLTIKPWHREQLMVYMFLLGVKHGVLYYISRDVMRYGKMHHTSITIEMNEKDSMEIAQKIATAHAFVSGGFIPSIKFKSKSECGFCPFIRYCWEDEKHEEAPSKNTLSHVREFAHAILAERKEDVWKTNMKERIVELDWIKAP